MTPEEKFNHQVWEILQKIKEDYIAAETGKPIEYEFPHVQGVGIIPKKRRRDIFYKLQEWKAIKIINESIVGNSTPLLEYQVLKTKFEEIYQKLQKACDLTTYLNEYQKNQLKGNDNLPEFGHLNNKKQTKKTARVKHKGQMFETGSGGGYYNRSHPIRPTKKLSANEIVNGFSHSNYAFVLMVTEGILSAGEFGSDGEADYQLQSTPGQTLVRERQLLSKFEKLGLFRHLGEDGVFAIAKLRDIDTTTLKQIVTEIKSAQSNTEANARLIKIEKWLDVKEGWALKKMWQVVSALYSEWQLQDDKAFNMPHDKFERARITAPKDLEAILKSLHKRKVIRVSRKIAETPPSSDPNKPQGSLWATITDKPDITHKADTLVEIFPDEFTHLRNSLRERVSKKPPGEDKIVSNRKIVVGPKKSKESQVQCCGLFYSFKTNQLVYSGGEKDISPETREMKFFLTLYQNKGQTVDYKIIAREANLQSYKDMSENGEVTHEDLQNKDFSEDASLLRRDFRKLVLSLGMSTDKFSKMIKTIKKQGYQLVCQ